MPVDTPKQKRRASRTSIWIISTVVALMFMGMGVFILKMLLSEDTHRRRRALKMVQLVKPPPPPKIKEKPPEPEIKKEEIIEPEPQETPPEDMSDVEDDTPPIDDLLGLDADGSGGMDGFGLKAKKGGRSLIGGDASRRFAWYTTMVQKQINEEVRTYLDENGGIPEGNLKTHVKIQLDDEGRILVYKIVRESGNQRMDDAVLGALAALHLREMPPMDMPKVMKFRISSKG